MYYKFYCKASKKIITVYCNRRMEIFLKPHQYNYAEWLLLLTLEPNFKKTMKRIFNSYKSFYPVILLIFIALTAISFLRLDRVRSNKRTTYEQFLIKTALPFKTVKQVNNGKNSEADSPDLAALQEYFMTMDPVEKRVPAERLQAAYAQLNNLQTRQTKSGAYQLEWTGTDAEMGGRTRAIMWDPLVNNKVWAGGVTGGLWYNNDITSADAPWQAVDDMWDNLAISSIVCDPNNSQIMYVGTGEVQTALITYRESSGRGVGIWRTTDSGQHWTLLPSTSAFAYVSKMVVRNESGNSVIYAGVASGYYHGIQQSQPTDGLYRSADGGQSWQQVLPTITGNNVPYAPADVALGADGKLYVGTMPNVDGNGGATVLYSNDGLPGSWSIYEDIAVLIPTMGYLPLPGRVMLATSASDANVVYAAFAAGIHDPLTQPIFRGLFIFRSNDKGLTWNEVQTPESDDTWANLAWHAMTLGVDPNDPNVLYAGGLDLWRTSDNGATWQHLSDWTMMYYGGGDTYVHADQHTIVYKPGSSSKILFGCDGGVFYTQNGNAATPVFEEINKHFNTLQFYSGAMHPGAGENKFMGGLQDNGTLLYQGTPLTINSMISGGDGAYCFWDQDDPSVYFTSVYYNRYYIFTNGAQTNYIDQYSGIFINPADYSSEFNTLYANASDFWGQGANLVLRVSNIPENGYGYFVQMNTSCNTYFSHVKVSPFSTSASTNLFLGSASGQLYKSKKANSFPITTEIGSPSFPEGSISCVAVGGSEDTLLVTFSNYGVSSVWQTYNGGQTWREVEGNLPDMPVRWAIYHPQNTKQALIATELGVWSTCNLNETNVVWTPQTTGMANVRVDMLTLRESDNTVLAASHGRGLFTCIFNKDINTSNHELTESDNPIAVFTNQQSIVFTLPDQHAAEYRIYALSGREVMNGKLQSGSSMQTIETGNLPHGVYLVKVQSSNRELVRKVVL